MNNIVIYCRVSSKEQVEGTSLESQERACSEYAARNQPKNSSCLTKVRWFRGIFAVGAG
jgi:DNA invertase Pin-like site-specific DNA recombinase